MKDFKITFPISIWRSGNKTIAYDPNTDKKAISRCHPDDTYDAYLGAKIALDRLFGREPFEEPPSNVTFRVLAIENDHIGDPLFIKGEVYEFIDGFTKWKNGFESCNYESYDDFIEHNISWENKFVELKPGDDPAEVLREYERYNGKFVALRNGYDFTKGKIYEVKDGYFINDACDKYPMSRPLRDLDDLTHYFRKTNDPITDVFFYYRGGIPFIEIKE